MCNLEAIERIWTLAMAKSPLRKDWPTAIATDWSDRGSGTSPD
jgi:hypothetical protein